MSDQVKQRKQAQEYRQRLLEWYAMMYGVYQAMPEEEKQDLLKWEGIIVDGSGEYGTSDWPGWSKYIDEKPKPPPRMPEQKKEPIPSEIRWKVWERDNFTCQHCGARRDLTIDHIVPESKGGTMELSNLQTLCRSCNSRKGTTSDN